MYCNLSKISSLQVLLGLKGKTRNMQNLGWLMGTHCGVLEFSELSSFILVNPYLGSPVSRRPEVSQDLQSHKTDSRVPIRIQELDPS